jgi:hypothetical protein
VTKLQIARGTTGAMIIDRLEWDLASRSVHRHIDRRRSYRLESHERAELLAPGANDATVTHEATIIDVSSGGFGIVVSAPICVGTHVVMRCRFGLAVGTVRRCECEYATGAYVCGIAFEHHTSSQYVLTELIEHARRCRLSAKSYTTRELQSTRPDSRGADC